MTDSQKPKQCSGCLYCATITYMERRSYPYCSWYGKKLRRNARCCRHFTYPGITIKNQE